MKWFFMRRRNPKFNTFVHWRSTRGPAISTQCSCSSESIFYTIKNWEFGGRTPLAYLYFTPVCISISAFEIHFQLIFPSALLRLSRFNKQWSCPAATAQDFISFHLKFNPFHHQNFHHHHHHYCHLHHTIIVPNCQWIPHPAKRSQRLQLRNSWTIRAWFQIVEMITTQLQRALCYKYYRKYVNKYKL